LCKRRRSAKGISEMLSENWEGTGRGLDLECEHEVLPGGEHFPDQLPTPSTPYKPGVARPRVGGAPKTGTPEAVPESFEVGIGDGNSRFLQ
jgi:hypothetical protein